MALWALWDPDTNNVVRIINDDASPLPTDLASGFTGAETSSTAKLVKYPLQIDYPDDYIPRFPALGGPATMLLEEDGKVHQRFPNADFSVGAVRKALRQEIDASTRVALFHTDWYFTRRQETGKAVPDDVIRQRLRIRARGDLLKSQVEDASPSALLDFVTVVPADV